MDIIDIIIVGVAAFLLWLGGNIISGFQEKSSKPTSVSDLEKKLAKALTAQEKAKKNLESANQKVADLQDKINQAQQDSPDGGIEEYDEPPAFDDGGGE